MTDSHDHGIRPADHGIQHGAAPAAAFSAEEWLQFQRSDRGGGQFVVGLMASIFIIGLLLYFSIALICWQSPW
jgi:hypothetical protein